VVRGDTEGGGFGLDNEGLRDLDRTLRRVLPVDGARPISGPVEVSNAKGFDLVDSGLRVEEAPDLFHPFRR
jgi:hypothetical protein